MPVLIIFALGQIAMRPSITLVVACGMLVSGLFLFSAGSKVAATRSKRIETDKLTRERARFEGLIFAGSPWVIIVSALVLILLQLASA